MHAVIYLLFFFVNSGCFNVERLNFARMFHEKKMLYKHRSGNTLLKSYKNIKYE